jgi:hypothetical protein
MGCGQAEPAWALEVVREKILEVRAVHPERSLPDAKEGGSSLPLPVRELGLL